MHTEGWLVITTAGEWDTGTNNQDTNENPNQHKRKLAVRIKQEESYDLNWNKKTLKYKLTEGENAEIEEFTTTPTHEAELHNPGALKLRILE